ncbi:MAG: polyphosphate kinase 1 [Ignavibacteriae bacterium]|nr:MAG: polyphosphate kinase 1 [Ignavibacteriota bacterium]
MRNPIYKLRDITWLSFNYRVLQEAKDDRVPLFERVKFLAIYSSNLDEFFRVRVAGIRSLINVSKSAQKKLNFNPAELIKKISAEINKYQKEYSKVFKDIIIPKLKDNNIYLINETELNNEQKEFVRSYFNEQIIPQIQPILLVKNKIVPFLRNRRLYLAVILKPKRKITPNAPKRNTRNRYAIVEIPSNHLPRFITLPSNDEKKYVIFLDDIIRFKLSKIFFGYDIVDSYAIKLTRDAELYIDDEFSGNLFEKIKKSLIKRNIGAPSRFLYDERIPANFLRLLKESFKICNDDLVPGAKYHNLRDLFGFPAPSGENFYNEPLPTLRHSEIDKFPNIFDAIKLKDYAVHFPYQTYDYVLQFLDQAADDPDVTSIYITQYRVAEDSEVVSTLVKAARAGKRVIVFVELKARFDEESNILWAEEMKSQGINVLYSFPGIKVHSKLLLIKRIENNEDKFYCYMATGNFNEKTARLYSDTGFFTSNPSLTKEVKNVFDYLRDTSKKPKFKKLLVAQFNMRRDFIKLIENEIKNAQKGKEAHIVLKMNSIEDKKMINKLYEASEAGVKIDLIIRGICCIVPGVPGLSKNINIISIVDRYLEHARIFIFHNGGDKKVYAGSADWMKRNLSRRIEVIFPIYDEEIKQEMIDIVNIQLNDNVKARIIDRYNKNEYKTDSNDNKIQSQVETYYYLEEKHSTN